MALKIASSTVACLLASMCGGTVTGKLTQTTPSGTSEYEIKGEWKKDLSTGTVTINIPGAPAGSGQQPGQGQTGQAELVLRDESGTPVRSVLLTVKNDGPGGITASATATDPWVVQIPSDWNLTGVQYATPAGAASGTITPGPIPSSLERVPSGAVIGINFYAAEPGYKTYLVEVPESILVSGRHTAVVQVQCGAAARRRDTVKIIETGILSIAGYSTRAFFPLNTSVLNFSTYSDPFLAFEVDLGVPQCSGPTGNQPRFALDGCFGWEIGSVGELKIQGLDLAAPAVYMAGGVTFLNPGIPLPGLGCNLNVSLDATAPLSVTPQGTASVAVAVPNDANLIGLALFWQAAQLYPNAAMLSTDMYKTVVEP